MTPSRKPAALGPDTPVGEAAPALLAAKAAPLFALECRAISGDDADAVHDLRVAARRTREALACFSALYRRRSARPVRRMLGRIGRTFGAVRDSDVFLAELDGLEAASVDTETLRVLAWLRLQAVEQREARLGAMRSDARELDLTGFRTEFDRATCDFKRSADLSTPLSELADAVIAERVRACEVFLPHALDPARAADQHALRIAVKHLRYAVETLAPALGDAAAPARATLVEYQDALGDVHDRDVFSALVRDAVAEPTAAAATLPRVGVDAVVAALAHERAEAFARFVTLVRSAPFSSLADRLGIDTRTDSERGACP